MTREMNRDVCVRINTSVDNHIIGNIIESYKDNNDNESYFEDSSDSSGVLTTARDGELICGTRVAQKDDGWYLNFQDGKSDGPYQEIAYDAEHLYCTIIFGLAYRYELSGLLRGAGSEYGYYAYLKQFIEKHKEDYQRFKDANYAMSADRWARRRRAVLFELDYRHQRQAYERAFAKQTDQQLSI